MPAVPTGASTTGTPVPGGATTGLRSGKGPGGRTRDQLYAEAKRRGVDGRSKMNKSQLARAVGR